jgi:hypothetical protein
LKLFPAKMRSVESNSSQRRTTRSFAPLIAGELLPTRGFYKTTIRIKRRKILEGFVILQAVTLFFLLTIKKKYVKLAREKDT